MKMIYKKFVFILSFKNNVEVPYEIWNRRSHDPTGVHILFFFSFGIVFLINFLQGLSSWLPSLTFTRTITLYFPISSSSLLTVSTGTWTVSGFWHFLKLLIQWSNSCNPYPNSPCWWGGDLPWVCPPSGPACSWPKSEDFFSKKKSKPPPYLFTAALTFLASYNI